VNFGEELVYWYFRLQGFFPLRNWVVHPDDENRHTADADLLAIRLPGAYEEVGGVPTDVERSRFERWGVDLSRDAVGFLVEVKAGNTPGHVRQGVEVAFSPPRVRAAVRRMGLWSPHDAEEVASRLTELPLHRDGRVLAAKLLVSRNRPRTAPIFPYLHLRLTDAAEFVKAAMARNMDAKAGARHFFPSDLLQYIIWDREQALRTRR
jgi:hypothetical protein